MPDTAVRAQETAPFILADRRSPNQTARRGVDQPDMVVLHYTGMETCAAAVGRLCDPAAEVSAHYVVDTDGTIHALVDETQRAWHAGRSSWGGVTDINSHSIGIEIANPGHVLGYPPFPEAQIRSGEFLVRRAMQRWRIPPERVVGHACIAPGRKIDPGEKFDWRRLALQGLAVWLDPQPYDGPVTSPDYQVFAALARQLGFAAPMPQHELEWPNALADVWRSFAMRFLPGKAGNVAPDFVDILHLQKLAARWPAVPPH